MTKKLTSVGAALATMAAAVVGLVALPSGAVQAASADYVAVTPVRLLDTRTTAKAAAGSVTKITVAGANDVPADAAAVWLNVTAVLPEAAGHLTVYSCDDALPGTSNVNYTAGSVSPNAVMSGLSETGEVCIRTHATTDILVDLNGYMPADGSPVPITPVRALDTRKTTMAVAGSVTKVALAGVDGVPAEVGGVMLNVTAVLPEADGHLTVYSCDETLPGTSNVNYTTGSVSPNAVMSGLGSDGEVCIRTHATTHILVDVMGYVPIDGAPIPIRPVRSLDTRKSTKAAADSVTEVPIGGTNGIPASANAAMLNVTAVLPEADGHLTVYSCDETLPDTSNVNYTTGSVSPNAVLSGLSATGKVCVRTKATTHIIVDVLGYTPATACTIQGTVVDSELPVSECDALVDFYTALDGPNWSSAGGWNTAVDPCTWAGVTCDGGHVTGLERTYRKLKGDIPASIEDLAYLKYLQLYGNSITSLPEEIQGMHLEVLELGLNDLSDLPQGIIGLTALTHLDLGDNDLTSIPLELANLTALKSLKMQGNDLSGDITEPFKTLKDDAPDLAEVLLAGNGCLTVTDEAVATWLTDLGSDWDDGC